MTERKKTGRTYRKDTFKQHQQESVKAHEERINEILVLLGKSEVKFQTRTQLAEHVSGQLAREDMSLSPSALMRKHHTLNGAKVPNPYRTLLLKYEMGKYFGKGARREIAAADVEAIRGKNPAIDAYCSLKEVEAGNLQAQVKMLTAEVARLNAVKALPAAGATGDSTVRLDKTVTALKRLLDAAGEFFEIDWNRRAIVDMSRRPPKVVVEPDLLTAFFEALENAGMRPEDV